MSTVKPAEVHAILGRHLLTDGLDLVFDPRRSQGSYLYDSRNGRQYLDFYSFFASQPIGFNHPQMDDPAFKARLAEIAITKPSNSDVYTVEMAEFVETFERVGIPPGFPHLFFVSGGALAVENALKASFDWKVRRNIEQGIDPEKGQKVIHFREAFHGRSGYTLSLTNTEWRKIGYFPKFDWPRIVNPKIRFPLDAHIDSVVAMEEQAVREIEQAIADNPNDIAALILEPIQGEGGDNHFRSEFFQKLRALADEHEFMFILDEVQTGVGLTGKMWAFEHFGVVPDMICFGKKMQICGFLASSRIDEVADNVFQVSSRINSTWGGNLVDMVRCQRYLEIIEEQRLVEHAADVGEYLLARLRAFEAENKTKVANSRGRGLMCAFDLESTEARDKAHKAAYQSGLLILKCGERSIRFRPSLSVAREDIDAGLGILDEVVATL